MYILLQFQEPVQGVEYESNVGSQLQSSASVHKQSQK